VTEQRYQAILAVSRDGRTVTEVASEWRVSRQTMHTWLSRYEAGGLEELGDRSHRPTSCPHQMSGELEAMVLELRRWKPYWGPHSLVLELARRKVASLPSESRVYRCREGLALPVRAPAAGLPVFPAGHGWMFSRSSRRLGCFGSQPSARRVWVLEEGWSLEKIWPRGP